MQTKKLKKRLVKPAPAKRMTWLPALLLLPFAVLCGVIGAGLHQEFGAPMPPAPILQHATLLCRSDFTPFSKWVPCVDRHGVMYDEFDKPAMEVRINYEQPNTFMIIQ